MRHLRIWLLQGINVFHFKLRALVWMFVGVVNTGIIVLYWQAASHGASLSPDMPSFATLTTYYVLIVAIGPVISYVDEDVADIDIQRGQLYMYLLKPYSYIRLKYLEEFFWRAIGLFWSLLLFIILSFFVPMVFPRDPVIWLAFGGALILCHFISFFFKMALGMTAFWITQIRGLMELMEVTTITLMGGILPLKFMPPILQTLAINSPFGSMLYAPVGLAAGLIGRAELPLLFLRQLVWLVAMVIAAKLIFKILCALPSCLEKHPTLAESGGICHRKRVGCCLARKPRRQAPAGGPPLRLAPAGRRV